MQTTKKYLGGIKLVLTNLSKRERILHLLIWISGFVIINIPQFEVTFGVFHSGDYSLIIPSIFGTVINGLIFYGNIYQINNSSAGKMGNVLKVSLMWFCLLSAMESGLDMVCFYFFYAGFSSSILMDILIGTFLLNGIFFFIPGIVYGIIKNGNTEKPKETKILIKDGVTEVYISLDDLLYIESDSNYSKYVCKSGKYLERKSLASLEKELPTQFVRCHKSYMVNTMLIDKKTSGELEIAGFKIPIGRKYGKLLELHQQNFTH